MKHLIYKLAILIIMTAFTSCNKEWTCSCEDQDGLMETQAVVFDTRKEAKEHKYFMENYCTSYTGDKANYKCKIR
jgi:hypothetical protein